MRLSLVLFFFFLCASFLIFVTINQKAEKIYHDHCLNIALNKIQLTSAKTYLRAKKNYVPKRSLILARKEIAKILSKEPIDFELNQSSFLIKKNLVKIVKILNNVKENVVLSIAAHTDSRGTAQHNLSLSQHRADKLKAYFTEKTNLLLVVAIGYGEAFALEQRLIEIGLQRIKQ